ncbi:MAG: hypothetical protein J6Z82_05950 [Schwartzia sp.]|nr:hypothetical protein [Schwartzia sp. (in: firmicutes)]
MFAKKLFLFVCLSVMFLFPLPRTALAGDVYIGTLHDKDYWLLEETIVLEEGIYKADTKNLRNGEVDSVSHWTFVNDGRRWYFMRGNNEQLTQQAGSPVSVERLELAQKILQYCMEYMENRR